MARKWVRIFAVSGFSRISFILFVRILSYSHISAIKSWGWHGSHGQPVRHFNYSGDSLGRFHKKRLSSLSQIWEILRLSLCFLLLGHTVKCPYRRNTWYPILKKITLKITYLRYLTPQPRCYVLAQAILLPWTLTSHRFSISNFSVLFKCLGNGLTCNLAGTLTWVMLSVRLTHRIESLNSDVNLDRRVTVHFYFFFCLLFMFTVTPPKGANCHKNDFHP